MSNRKEVLRRIEKRHCENDRQTRKFFNHEIEDEKRPYQGDFILVLGTGKIKRSQNADYLREIASFYFHRLGITSCLTKIIQYYD
jgi:hypothetical protein